MKDNNPKLIFFKFKDIIAKLIKDAAELIKKKKKR
jgi:hypothetical protein